MAVPKPPPSVKAARKPLRATKWGVSDKPRTALKTSGETKAKKAARQQKFYRSVEWKVIRQLAIHRANNRCEHLVSLSNVRGTNYSGLVQCGESTNLTVHHLTYARFGGDEILSDLRVLCKAHHAEVELTQHPHRHHRKRAY